MFAKMKKRPKKLVNNSRKIFLAFNKIFSRNQVISNLEVNEIFKRYLLIFRNFQSVRYKKFVSLKVYIVLIN